MYLRRQTLENIPEGKGISRITLNRPKPALNTTARYDRILYKEVLHDIMHKRHHTSCPHDRAMGRLGFVNKYIYIHIYIYIYYPLYTHWPITNADLPHVIIQFILYFICQKLYWTVSGQLSNIGYIGQFQNETTGTLRTRYRRTKAVSMYLMKILSIFLHLQKILICFRIGWFYSE